MSSKSKYWQTLCTFSHHFGPNEFMTQQRATSEFMETIHT